jgi:GNAT superfamily N-acetyltransferase
VPVSIRTSARADYVHLSALNNASFPDFTKSPEEMEFDDEKRPPHIRFGRWVAELDGKVVGYGSHDQHVGVFHPRKFIIDVVVDPSRLGQGVGTLLYDSVADALLELEPMCIDTWSREDMACRLRFFRKRGFREHTRIWSSTLDVATFDPAPFESYVRAVEAQGIQIRSLAELQDDPDRERKAYDLWCEVRLDMPVLPGDEQVEVPFEMWVEHHHRHPTLLPEGHFIALDGDRYVGTSQLWKAPEEHKLRTGLTGTRRAYRRRGIAAALKLRALGYAKAHGAAQVDTENDASNAPMLALNARIGFQKRPAWIHLRKSV